MRAEGAGNTGSADNLHKCATIERMNSVKQVIQLPSVIQAHLRRLRELEKSMRNPITPADLGLQDLLWRKATHPILPNKLIVIEVWIRLHIPGQSPLSAQG